MSARANLVDRIVPTDHAAPVSCALLGAWVTALVIGWETRAAVGPLV